MPSLLLLLLISYSSIGYNNKYFNISGTVKTVKHILVYLLHMIMTFVFTNCFFFIHISLYDIMNKVQWYTMYSTAMYFILSYLNLSIY